MPRRALFIAAILGSVWLPLARGGEVGAEQSNRVPSAPIRDPEHTFRHHVTSWTELRKENVVMQKRDYSCGAAALATVIRYHWDGDVTELDLLQELVQMLTVEELKDRIEKGLAMTDLRRLAVRVGYQSTIGRLEFEKLRKTKIPLIVGIVINDFDHFVVYRGTDGQYVYLADPARGNIRTPIPEFLDQWQKNMVLVVVKPGVERESWSELLLQPDEVMLGESNRLYLRDRTTTKVFPH